MKRLLHPCLLVLGAGCFSGVAPKGKSASTTGNTTGTPFVSSLAVTDASLFDFDGAAVEVTDAARLKARRFRVEPSDVQGAPVLTRAETRAGAWQQKALSDGERRAAAQPAGASGTQVWLSLDDAQPHGDLFPTASGDNQAGACSSVDCPTSVQGVIGTALHFGLSTTNTIGLNNATSLPDGTQSRVICAWGSLGAAPASADTALHWAFVYGEQTDNKAMAVGVRGTRVVGSTYGSSGLVVSPEVLSPATTGWQHLCFGWAESDALFSLWLNGVLVATQAEGGGLLGDMGALSGAFAFVGMQLNGFETWFGEVDEPLVFVPYAGTTSAIGDEVARLQRFTRPGAIFDVAGGTIDATFDAATAWPWAELVVEVDAPYGRLPPTVDDEAGFGALGFPANGSTWRFAFDRNGGPWDDRAGQGHVASCAGGATCPNADPDLHLAHFDGSAFLTVAGADGLSDTHTVCAFASLDSQATDNGYGWLVSMGQTSSHHALALGRVGRGLVVSQWGGDIIAPDFWNFGGDGVGAHLVCATISGSTVSLYGDGALLTTGDFSGFALMASGNSAFIGQQLSSAQRWQGNIGFVATWSRALTATEIAALSARTTTFMPLQMGSALSGVPVVVGPSGVASAFTPDHATVLGTSYAYSVPAALAGKPLFRVQQTVSSLDQVSAARVLAIEARPAQLPPTALITPKTSVAYGRLTSLTVELGTDHLGEVKFRLLKDGTPLFWNGTIWAAAAATDGNTAAEATAHLPTFPSPGEVKWQALLDSVDRLHVVSLKSVTLSGER